MLRAQYNSIKDINFDNIRSTADSDQIEIIVQELKTHIAQSNEPNTFQVESLSLIQVNVNDRALKEKLTIFRSNSEIDSLRDQFNLIKDINFDNIRSTANSDQIETIVQELKRHVAQSNQPNTSQVHNN